MASDIPPEKTDRQWQPGYTPGAPVAFLGLAFVVVWALWLSQVILSWWQHPLALACAFLLLPLVGFIALNVVNIFLALAADLALRLCPPLRRWPRRQLVTVAFIGATTALAIRGLAPDCGLLAFLGSAIWLASLPVALGWSLIALRAR